MCRAHRYQGHVRTQCDTFYRYVVYVALSLVFLVNVFVYYQHQYFSFSSMQIVRFIDEKLIKYERQYYYFGVQFFFSPFICIFHSRMCEHALHVCMHRLPVNVRNFVFVRSFLNILRST